MALVIAAAFAGAILQSAVGFGFALVLGPALFAVLEPADALFTVLALSILLNSFTLLGEGRQRHVRPELPVLLAASLPGLAAGALIFTALSRETLQIAIGVAVIAAAAIDQGREGSPVEAAERPIGAWTAIPVGVAAGALTTTTSTNGPPLLLFFRARGFSPAEVRDTMAAILLALNLIGIPLGFLFSDPGLGFEAGTFLALMATVIAGVLVGRSAFTRMEARHFHAVGLVLVVIAGVASLLAGAGVI
ncbi:MAG: sulfite exporter TauE/SafE family protein [Solirubrobacterales bacterium]|nr:sulfite exporter TauE/SafE family protein [Solirubrobacterales bacterium]